ncbi:YciI family protein [Bacillus sp. Marseille-Q3570]|uniref:YciI family protein n=1 Tax=Bacillus sp. Marseille-Q3570 TaxID=2963522 RepID=UPI0021B7A5D9|nr:YciI family protein [Bacillus sp. Marseille-Q3570]
MKYLAAVLPMKDQEKSAQYRPQHLEYLEEQMKKGRIFAKGRFSDGTGGLVIYMAPSLEEVMKIAENDPYVLKGARELEMHEWEMDSPFNHE